MNPGTWHLVDLGEDQFGRELQVGDVAKVGFEVDVPVEGFEREWMWVEVDELLDAGRYIGALRSLPVLIPLGADELVTFEGRHVLEVHRE